MSDCSMHPRQKYARVEWERRFVLDGFPEGVSITRVRHIRDLYIKGTTLRLREMSDSLGHVEFKLTQKLAKEAPGARQGLITTLYLTKGEFDLLATMPGKWLAKTRCSVPPFGIDAFEGELRGLFLAEAEFGSEAEATRLELPAFLRAEVTNDPRFQGGSLVRSTREELANSLADYGVALQPSDHPGQSVSH